ncbi:hypothetical protein [Serratia ureilytica]|uniref:gp53-like domain-containing protein n=1 Tax=Serratia ureilytica TaxID=300181 RepID=UPI0039FCC721
MHRIDTPTAQVDKFGQGKNGFTNGDRTTGRRATELNSDMWDAVQEEIANAIEGAGILLDKSKHNQLYLAIKKLLSESGANYLLKQSNLSDLINKSEARKNIDVYSKGEGDSRFLIKANNLSDLSNKGDSRFNLDVYSKGETQQQAANIAQEKANSAENNAKKWANDNCYNQYNQPPAQSSFTLESWYWADVNNRTNRIMQGGTVYRTADVMTVTFPIAFPLGCVSVLVTQTAQMGVSSQNIIVQNVTKTSFDLVMRSSETQCYWMAVGA